MYINVFYCIILLKANSRLDKKDFKLEKNIKILENELKKDGICVTEKLDTLTINSIAKNISQKLCQTFPNFGLNQNDLFIRLSRLDMYKAKMQERNVRGKLFL